MPLKGGWNAARSFNCIPAFVDIHLADALVVYTVTYEYISATETPIGGQFCMMVHSGPR